MVQKITKKALVRKNIYMAESIAKWYEDRSEELGIGQSAIMVVALQFYIDYQTQVNFAKQISGLDLVELAKQLPKE